MTFRTAALVTAILVAAALVGSKPAGVHAATFLVNGATDEVDASPGDGACATAGDVCTLRAAVQEANETPGRDTITVPAGTYTLTIAGDHEDAAAQDDLDILEDLTINGAGQATTFVDGGGFTRIFDIIPTDVDVDISGLTVRNGMAPTIGGGIDNHANLTLTDVTITGNTGPKGGGISNRGDLTLTRVTLNGNTAPSGGGGLWIEPEGSAAIHESSLQSNQATGGFSDGGGILNEGALTVISSTLTGNSSSGDGGAIASSGTLFLSGSTIDGNTSGGYGAVNIDGEGSAEIAATTFSDNERGGMELLTTGPVSIADSTFAGNFGSNGGAISVENDGPLTIRDTTMTGNTAGNLGGAIFQDDTVAMTIERVTFSGNSAGRGGVIAILDEGPTTLTNVTMSGNSATQQGGAIWRGWAAPFTVINSTIVNNDSPTGGGIYAEETEPFTLKNTIIANNTDANCAFDLGGKTTSQGHNLSSDNTCKLNASSDLKNTDPKLAPLADNGGPTQTHALLLDSPAIDAGDGNGCPDEDQRGGPRPVDGPDDDSDPECDIGAYEFGAIVATPTPSPTPEPQLLQGDADCNNVVNSVDSLKVLRYVAQLSVAQGPDCPLIGAEVASFFGDVDCSGAVNSVDALKILRFVAQLSVAQTEPCPNIGDPL